MALQNKQRSAYIYCIQTYPKTSEVFKYKGNRSARLFPTPSEGGTVFDLSNPDRPRCKLTPIER